MRISAIHKTTLLTLSLLFLSPVLNSPAFAQKKAKSPKWMTDLAKATKLAKKENRLLLLHFYADWCTPCRKMERETLSSNALAVQFAGKIVAVKINSDKNPDVVKKYGIKALPSDVFVAPSGQILSRTEGYHTQRQYLSLVARIDAVFDNSEKVRIAKSRPNGRKPAKTIPSPNIKPSRKRIIGMDGFSPVALHEHRKWTPGKKQFAWRYQDVTFWMSDAKELALFKSDPRRYAPRLLGCDPVLLNESDKAVQGKIAYGAFFDGHLYFFATSVTRKKFRANPLPYTRTRHVLRVDHIGGTVRR